MKIDMHFHVLGRGKKVDEVDTNVFLNFDDNHHWFTRMLSNLLQRDLEGMGADFNEDGEISTDEYFRFVYDLIRSSELIDGVVLLGMDAVFSPETGELDEKRTDLWISNRFLHTKVKDLNDRLRDVAPGKKVFMGASVSPNRKKSELEAELDFVFNQTDAVLMKLIPSTQHIQLTDPKHRAFYEALAEHDMPLLCHVGPEYAFPEGIRKKALDSFRYLEKPLEHGVTVIAAHCATPVFPVIDKNEIQEFYEFMKQANAGDEIKLWADTSALSLSTRIPLIPEIVKTFSPEWLLHGSDFPIPIDGWPHLPWVTTGMDTKEYLEIVRTTNPLDRDVLIKRAHGFSDKILDNAQMLFGVEE